MTETYDAGADLFKREPDMVLVSMWWHAGTKWRELKNQQDFVQGYMDARRRKDEYEREKPAEAKWQKLGDVAARIVENLRKPE